MTAVYRAVYTEVNARLQAQAIALGGPIKSVYNLDGSASQNSYGPTATEASKITWDGAKLTIATAGAVNRTATWSLDAVTMQLTIETTLDVGVTPLGPMVTTGVYTKK